MWTKILRMRTSTIEYFWYTSNFFTYFFRTVWSFAHTFNTLVIFSKHTLLAPKRSFLPTSLKWPHSLRAIRAQNCPFWINAECACADFCITPCKTYYSLFLSRRGKNIVALINCVLNFCYQYFCFEIFLPNIFFLKIFFQTYFSKFFFSTFVFQNFSKFISNFFSKTFFQIFPNIFFKNCCFRIFFKIFFSQKPFFLIIILHHHF